MQTLVPQTELTFPLHFGRCEQPPPPPPPDGTELGASGALPPRGERVARVQLSEGQWNGGRPVPAPSSGYPYAVHLCLTLPESPPNEAAGMVDVSLQLEAASGAAGPLLQVSRSVVLRFKSQLLRWLWTCFYALPMLVGLMEEKQQHCLEMAPHFLNPRAGAAHARVAISDCGVQVYEA